MAALIRAQLIARDSDGETLAATNTILHMVGGQGFLSMGQAVLAVTRSGHATTAVLVTPDLDLEWGLPSWPEHGETLWAGKDLVMKFDGPVITIRPVTEA